MNRFGHRRIWPVFKSEQIAYVYNKKSRLVDFTNKADRRTAGNLVVPTDLWSTLVDMLIND